MSEYIEREAAIETVFDPFTMSMCLSVAECVYMNRAREIIDKQLRAIPAADVAPVKRGRWTKNDNGTWSCERCHSWIPEEQHYYARFCLYCGARMNGGENDE